MFCRILITEIEQNFYYIIRTPKSTQLIMLLIYIHIYILYKVFDIFLKEATYFMANLINPVRSIKPSLLRILVFSEHCYMKIDMSG